MSKHTTTDMSQNGGIKYVSSTNSVQELEEYDFSRLPSRPRNLNLDRQRSFDERSLTDLPMGLSPYPSSRAENNCRPFDNLFSPGRRSGYNTPTSQCMGFEPHPMVSEAWDNLRRSLVVFRGQPVGTIAALDNSDEKLNYDQVKTLVQLLVIQCILHSPPV